jgi:hypothetical protein
MNTPAERAPGTRWTGGRVGPRTGLDAMERRIFSYPYQELNPGCSSRSLSLYRLIYSGSLSVTPSCELLRLYLDYYYNIC